MLPKNPKGLVWSVNSLEGVRHAVEVGKGLRQNGHELAGIRLDSGDLAFLSIEARKILDAAGFQKAAIIGSNDLDEYIITSLKEQKAAINVWGVGTKLVTAYDQPALGGVYKLSAIRDQNGVWQPRIKLSEQAAKITNPAIQQVRRFRSQREFLGDAIYDISGAAPESFVIVDPLDPTRRKHFEPETPHEDLLIPVFRGGKIEYQWPSIQEIRRRVQDQLAMFHPGVKRFVNPHEYPAGLELGLHERKMELVLKARGEAE